MLKMRSWIAIVAMISLTTVLAGCSTTEQPTEGEADNSITVWSLEAEPPRLAIAQKAADAFTEETGIKVELVGVIEDQFPQLIAAAAAAGTMPDIVGALTLAGVRTMSVNDLVNTEANAEIVAELGEETFSESAIALTRDGEAQVAVPSDGNVLAVAYRKDLFAAAGLPAPTTYEDLMNAAVKLNTPDMAGFVSGTSPSTNFTRQVFEHVALANGCELVDDSGELAIKSPECVQAMKFYGDLVTDYSVPGAMDTTSTKTIYMGGKAAIMMWGSGVLDEMAGLVNDAKPTCPECAADPLFIAKNTGFSFTLEGPEGDGPVTGGELSSFVVSSSAEVEASKEFVKYFMNDGYLPWLSQTPEGKLPSRLGTADEPQKFVEGWKTLESGVETRAKLTDIYPPEAITEMLDGMGQLKRWGFTEGQGNLIGAELPQLVFSKAIAALSTGDVDAQGAVDQVDEEIQAIKDALQ